MLHHFHRGRTSAGKKGNQMTLEQMKAEEAKLWAEYLELLKPSDRKRDEWLAVHHRRQDMELRESVREELREELAKKAEAA